MIPKEKKIDKGYYNDAEHPLGEEEQKKVQAVAEKGQPATAGAAVGRPEQTTGQPRTTQELLDYIGSNIERTKPETEGERKARERRERAEGIVSGIADIGSALANMYYANKGASSVYDPANGLSPRMRERWEKAKAEREKKSAEHMTWVQMKKKVEDGELANRLKSEANEIAKKKETREQEKYERENERKDALNKARVDSYNAMTKYREAIAAKNEKQVELIGEQIVFLQEKTKYLGLGYSLKESEAQARIDLNEAKRNGTIKTMVRNALGEVTEVRTSYGNDGGGSSSGGGKKKALPNQGGKKRLPQGK